MQRTLETHLAILDIEKEKTTIDHQGTMEEGIALIVI